MPRLLPLALVGLLSTTAPADELEPLDAEFLEYLAHLEGDDDDWTLIAPAEEVQKPPEEADPEPGESSDKASQPADRSAVDER